MSAVQELSAHEQYLTDDDPDLLRYQEASGSIRWLELLRAYLLRDRLTRTPREQQEEVIQWWAKNTGRSAGALKGDLKWAHAIQESDLTGAFEAEGIDRNEWTSRIGTSHLGVIARARDQETHRLLSSRERAQWAVRCYHANWSVDELKQVLRDCDLLPPAKARMGAEPIPKGTPTLWGMIIAIAQQEMAAGRDLDLSGMFARRGQEKPINVQAFLAFAAGEYRREPYDAAEFTLSTGTEGGDTSGTQTRS